MYLLCIKIDNKIDNKMQVSFKPIVYLHRQRKDNKYSVIIRIGFRSKYAFIETDLSVGKTDLKKNGEIKNTYILNQCGVLMKKYTDIASSVPDINILDVSEIKKIIEEGSSLKAPLNFSKLFGKFIDENKNSPSIDIYRTTHKHLSNFAGNSVLVNSISPHFLSSFEKHLKEKGIGSRGVNLYLSTIRKIYNIIMDEYEYKGYEFRYPFRKYKIPKAVYGETSALTKDQLSLLINSELKGVLANRARDLFVISLLTLGTNAKDLYVLDKSGVGDRIEYNRSKTKDVRDDGAFISIKVEPELIPYLGKYRGSKKALILSEWYSTPPKLNEGIRRGLKQAIKQINEAAGKDMFTHLEYYDARRTVSSIMRNELGISTDDIALCLNHVNRRKDLDPYLKTDWSVIDRANRKFIDWLFG